MNRRKKEEKANDNTPTNKKRMNFFTQHTRARKLWNTTKTKQKQKFMK
jgi:hypothetical protein